MLVGYLKVISCYFVFWVLFKIFLLYIKKVYRGSDFVCSINLHAKNNYIPKFVVNCEPATPVKRDFSKFIKEPLLSELLMHVIEFSTEL